MKKIIKILFLFFIVSYIFSIDVNAADSNIFSVTEATGSKGEEVTIFINLDKKLDFASADLVLEYDKAKLEFVKYEELDVLKQSAMNIVKDNPDTGKIAIGYVSNPESNDLTKNPGKMLSITFKILTSSEGNANLKLSVVSLKKDNGENIEASNTNSKIKIVTNENKNQVQDVDNTTVDYYNKEKTKLPNAGNKMIYIISFIGICLIFSIYSYKKYIYLRKV